MIITFTIHDSRFTTSYGVQNHEFDENSQKFDLQRRKFLGWLGRHVPVAGGVQSTRRAAQLHQIDLTVKSSFRVLLQSQFPGQTTTVPSISTSTSTLTYAERQASILESSLLICPGAHHPSCSDTQHRIRTRPVATLVSFVSIIRRHHIRPVSPSQHQLVPHISG